jgi:hypothetical protein
VDPVPGNLCQVNAVTAPPDSAKLPPADVTRCVTWPQQDGSDAVGCYTGAGPAIACCGHGLLVAAGFWFCSGARGRVETLEQVQETGRC